MRKWWMFAAMALLAGCQTAPVVRSTGGTGDALARLAAALPGEYDNHEQVQAGAHGAIAVPHLGETWKAVGDDWWMLNLRIADATHPLEATWLYRMAATGARIKLTPYRALEAEPAELLGEPNVHFKFVAAQWAELAPCAQAGEWKSTQFSAAADAAACSALLPGLGESAALLPLRVTLEGDVLHTATFADQARGAEAGVDARRMRWFDGWAAINGGGPKAQSDNQDWHMQRDLRLSSEGGRVPLRWRDGATTGWSLELARTSYSERKLNVLQLNVIDDASGRVLDYVWANPQTNAIGFNLGWLQVGLTESSAR